MTLCGSGFKEAVQMAENSDLSGRQNPPVVVPSTGRIRLCAITCSISITDNLPTFHGQSAGYSSRLCHAMKAPIYQGRTVRCCGLLGGFFISIYEHFKPDCAGGLHGQEVAGFLPWR